MKEIGQGRERCRGEEVTLGVAEWRWSDSMIPVNKSTVKLSSKEQKTIGACQRVAADEKHWWAEMDTSEAVGAGTSAP